VEHHALTGEITGHHYVILSRRDHHAATTDGRQRRNIALANLAGDVHQLVIRSGAVPKDQQRAARRHSLLQSIRRPGLAVPKPQRCDFYNRPVRTDACWCHVARAMVGETCQPPHSSY
jgi:hypothetical protein